MNIGVVGLGLIGGSLAKAIKANTDHTVWGTDKRTPVIYKAKLLDVIDAELKEEDLAKCDIVILAIYPRDTLAFLEQNAGRFKKGCVDLRSQPHCRPLYRRQ